MILSAINALIATELAAVNQTILQSLESQVEDIPKIGDYLINSGGKRIRPLMLLLSAKACGVQDSAMITMAAIIEFIHSATLLHDDVVDGSQQRRGRPTANLVWDNASAVLVGDFLYSRAFQMMVSLQSMPAMKIMANTTNAIAEGEVLQLSHRFEPNIDEARYFTVIELKTAKLFEAAAQLGATLARQNDLEQALATYGLHLGIAYQLIDDLLDYQADAQSLGKNIGDDLAEGKITLPLIYALQHGTSTQANRIRQAIQAGKLSDLAEIQQALLDTGALHYVREQAKKHSQLALDALSTLPASPYQEALASLAQLTVIRQN